MEPNALSAAPRRHHRSTKGALLASALTFGMCLALGAPAVAQTINTGAGGLLWDMGTWGDGEVGNPILGQTFVAPRSAASILGSIDFGLKQIEGGPMPYRAAIYAWNGRTVIGSALSQSALSITPLAVDTTRIRLNMTGSALTPGARYVLVLTTPGVGRGGVGPGGSGFELRASVDGTYTDGNVIYGLDYRLVNGTYASLDDVDLDLLLMFRPAGPDAARTLLGLQSNAYAVRSVLSQRAATTTFALDYDCSVFYEHGLCVSVGARNSQIRSDSADGSETAGLLTAAYRVSRELRIGGFIDQNLVSRSPVGVDPKNTQPMVGAFAVYQENLDFSGLTIRAALAHQEGDLRITRPELTNTEAGTGRARTTALAFGGEIAYGFRIDDTWVAQPYAGLRRSDSRRRGYGETTSDSVEFPITYNRFGQQVTSATAGLRLRGAITPTLSLTLGAGMEYGLDGKMDRYSGTSTIPGLETFSVNASQQQHEMRAVGSAGMQYMVASNQAVAFDASVRQLPYGNAPSITTMLRYAVGF